MATIKTEEEEKAPNAKQSGAAEGQTLVQSTAPTPVAATQGKGTVPGTPRKPTTSGSFQDVGKYLKARTPEQIKESAQRVAGQLGSQFQQKAQQFAKEGQQFAGGIGTIGDITKGRDISNIDQQAFQRQLQGDYGKVGTFAPSSSERLESLQKDIQGTETRGGKIAALQQLIKERQGPRLTQGGQLLSGSLLERPAESREIFSKLRGTAAQTGAQTRERVGSDIARAKQARAESITKGKESARDWYAGQKGALQKAIEDRIAASGQRLDTSFDKQFAERWQQQMQGRQRDAEYKNLKAQKEKEARDLALSHASRGLDTTADADLYQRLGALNLLAGQTGLEGVTDPAKFRGLDPSYLDFTVPPPPEAIEPADVPVDPSPSLQDRGVVPKMDSPFRFDQIIGQAGKAALKAIAESAEPVSDAYARSSGYKKIEEERHKKAREAKDAYTKLHREGKIGGTTGETAEKIKSAFS